MEHSRERYERYEHFVHYSREVNENAVELLIFGLFPGIPVRLVVRALPTGDERDRTRWTF